MATDRDLLREALQMIEDRDHYGRLDSFEESFNGLLDRAGFEKIEGKSILVGRYLISPKGDWDKDQEARDKAVALFGEKVGAFISDLNTSARMHQIDAAAAIVLQHDGVRVVSFGSTGKARARMREIAKWISDQIAVQFGEVKGRG